MLQQVVTASESFAPQLAANGAAPDFSSGRIQEGALITSSFFLTWHFPSILTRTFPALYLSYGFGYVFAGRCNYILTRWASLFC